MVTNIDYLEKHWNLDTINYARDDKTAILTIKG